MLGVPVEMGPQLLDWSHQMVAMYMHGRTRETEETANRAAREFSDFLARLCRRATQAARRRPAVAADRGAGGRPEAQSRTNWCPRPSCCSMPAMRRPCTRPAMPCVRSWRKAATPAASLPRRTRLRQRWRNACASTRRCICSRAMPMRRSRSGPAILLKPGEQIGAAARHGQSRSPGLCRTRRFRPGRADQKNVSFGAGIHFCIGAPLARLELQVSLKVLFERLPRLAPCGRAALPRHLSFPWAGKARGGFLTSDRTR